MSVWIMSNYTPNAIVLELSHLIKLVILRWKEITISGYQLLFDISTSDVLCSPMSSTEINLEFDHAVRSLMSLANPSARPSNE